MTDKIVPQDLPGWRTRQREALLERRTALAPQVLAEYRGRIDIHLQRAFPDLAHQVVGFCWPYRGEYDARHLLANLRRGGTVTVLPAVVGRGRPLEFRFWQPGVALKPGTLGIPYPPDSEVRTPDTVLVPVVGFDAQGYRLGYGGGYFDRTLAALSPRPRAIAVSYEITFIETIFPQPHDIPMDYVVTERGVYRRDGDTLRFLERGGVFSSPPCLAGEIAPGYFGEKSDPSA